MPNEQDIITDNAQAAINEYFSLAVVLQDWRPGQPYPAAELQRLLGLDRRAESLVLQINATSAQQTNFLARIATIRTSLQVLGGSRMEGYIQDRLGEIWNEGQQASSPLSSLWRDRMQEVFDMQSLINSNMLVVSEEERSRLLAVWSEGANRIDEVWSKKVVV